MAAESKLHRITGEMMKDFLSFTVGILGEVTEVDNSGNSFKIRTGDNIIITVYLEEPADDAITGFVEVIGKVSSKTTIVCSNMIAFPSEMTSKFDISDYTKAVNLIHQNKNTA